jgi:hypothetical protein
MNEASRYQFRMLDEACVVADLATRKINILNDTGALIFLELLESARSSDELATRLTKHSSLTYGDALHHIDLLLNDLNTQGFVTRDSSGFWQVQNSAYEDVVRPEDPRSVTLLDLEHNLTLGWSACIGSEDSAVRVDFLYNPAVALFRECARLSGMLSGMQTSEKAKIRGKISCVFNTGDIRIYSSGQSWLFTDALIASGFFFNRLIKELYSEYNEYALVHAGTISNGCGTILLPAVSGSGKTTLTGYLVSQGWRYGGDDVVGIGRVAGSHELRVLPLTTALSVKEGSITLLGKYFPALYSAQDVEYGSKMVRYTPMSSDAFLPAEQHTRRPSALVFPQYQANSPCQLDELSQVDGFRMLIDAGAGDGAGIGPESFGVLIDLISSVPSFTLRYSDLGQALGKLEALYE